MSPLTLLYLCLGPVKLLNTLLTAVGCLLCKVSLDDSPPALASRGSRVLSDLHQVALPGRVHANDRRLSRGGGEKGATKQRARRIPAGIHTPAAMASMPVPSNRQGEGEGVEDIKGGR